MMSQDTIGMAAVALFGFMVLSRWMAAWDARKAEVTA